MAYTLTPYKKLLEMGKAAVEATLVPIRASQARKQGELKMMEIEEKLITIESKIQEESIKHPLQYEKIIELLDERGLLERRCEQFKKIIGELFPTEE